MRDIKFRGKRINNDEWVCGDLTRYSEEMSYITVDLVENEVYQVHTETVGQYTGLKDKNGVEIYEGDIVKFTRFAGNPTTGTYKLTDMCIVKWVNEKCSFRLCYKTQKQKMLEGYEYEIIGNIYENKELLQN